MAHDTGVLAKLQDWVVSKGIAAEIKKSNLVEDSVNLPFGRVSFLRSKQASTSTERVILLHGATADNTSWVRFARYLNTDQALVIPDLPGHGKSVCDPTMSFTIEAQASYLMQFFDAINVRKLHIIGNSMGAAIALNLASTHPGLVASLVLIGAAGVRVEDSWLDKHIAVTGHNPMIQVRSKTDYRAMVKIGMSKPPFMPGFVISALSRAFIGRARINERIYKDIIADLDQSAKVVQVSCPVTIIWGREDKVSSVANAHELHRLLKGSQLLILDGIGHVPMVEAPKESAALLDFPALASTRPPPGAARRSS